MRLLRGSKTQKVLSHLLLALAAATMLATSESEVEAFDTAGGTVVLGPNRTEAVFEIDVVASGPAVRRTAKDPWQAYMEYALNSPQEVAPKVDLSIEPLPGDSPTDSDSFSDRFFPEHPLTCTAGEDCNRSYRVSFRLHSPTSAEVMLEWQATAKVIYSDLDELPDGASLRLDVSGTESVGDYGPLYTTEQRPDYSLRLASGQGVDNFVPIRLALGPGDRPGRVTAVSYAFNDSNPGTIALIPEDSRRRTITIPVGGTSKFVPIWGCPQRGSCTFDYQAVVKLNRDDPAEHVETSVEFFTGDTGLSVVDARGPGG